jgi:MoaA/NifB/PqqE/SkfB family radical SAM enzyme
MGNGRFHQKSGGAKVNPFAGQIFYRIFRRWGRPEILPLNYTISVTSRCNYRCATCRIHEKKLPELTLADYGKLFASLGRAPYWVTFSGGEPFIREDFRDIVDSFCGSCRPRLVNIPTNGSFPERTANAVRYLAAKYKRTGFIVNVSLDATGQEQNMIRGNENAWSNALDTIEALKRGRPSNLMIGIGTVISKANIRSFKEQRSQLSALGVDSMVAEVAEKRAELLNSGLDITLSAEEYRDAAEILIGEIDARGKRGWAGLAQVFRRQYYRYVLQVLQGGPGLRCYAGFASVQIMPDGEVWGCCITGDEMGRLDEFGYDFKKLWHSSIARQARRTVKERRCFCPLANAYYTNAIFDIPTSIKILSSLIF